MCWLGLACGKLLGASFIYMAVVACRSCWTVEAGRLGNEMFSYMDL